MNIAIKLIAPTFILLITSGCNNHSQKPADATILPADTTMLTADTTILTDKGSAGKPDYGNRTCFDPSTVVLETVYVLDRNGADLIEKPDTSSMVLEKLVYGNELDVIEKTDDYLGVWTKSQFPCQEYRGNLIKAYVHKESIGYSSQVKLTSSDLSIITSIELKNKPTESNIEKPLNRYLEFEVIDKNLFDSKKSTAVSFLKADGIGVNKRNDTLRLKTKKGIVEYVDGTGDADGSKYTISTSYIGTFDFFNKYLVYREDYEYAGYDLIDKVNGESSLQDCWGFPYISPDKKFLISVYGGPYYDTQGNIRLYSIAGGKCEFIFYATFKNWEPVPETDGRCLNANCNGFWSTDGFLYIPVFPIVHARTKKENFYQKSIMRDLRDNIQYIKIKVKL